MLCERLVDVLDVAYSEVGSESEQLHLRAAALATCLEAVPQPQRRLLELRYSQLRSSEQIGDLLHRSADAIRQELVRLRARLKECIQRRLLVESPI
jgi:RNA polymerase sigma-70 factor (ECF subfamily)